MYINQDYGEVTLENGGFAVAQHNHVSVFHLGERDVFGQARYDLSRFAFSDIYI